MFFLFVDLSFWVLKGMVSMDNYRRVIASVILLCMIDFLFSAYCFQIDV